MKLKLTLCVILLVISLAFIPWVHGQVNAKNDQVTITEEVIMGDPAIAEGLELKMEHQMGHHLFWNIAEWPGTDRVAESSFQFFPEQQNSFDETNMHYFDIRLPYEFDVYWESQVDEDPLNEHETLELRAAVREVVERAPLGQDYTEYLPMKEFFQYQPLRFLVQLDRESSGKATFNSVEHGRQITEYLGFPVSEDQQIKVTVGKDMTGNYASVSVKPVNDWVTIPLDGGFLLEEGGYLLADSEKNGYGIHHFPMIKVSEKRWDDDLEEWGPDMTQLRNVFSLEKEKGKVLTLLHVKENDQILLITEEEGQMKLTVIDRKTMVPVQELELGVIAGDETFHRYQKNPGTVMFTIVDDQREEAESNASELWPDRILLLKNDGGDWTVGMDVPLDWSHAVKEDVSYRLGQSCVFVYDGRRLAVAQWGRSREASSAYVMIMEENTVKYIGKYDREDAYGRFNVYDGEIRCAYSDDSLQIRWN